MTMAQEKNHSSIHDQIISSLTSGVLAVDATGEIITANPAAARHLNLTCDALAPGTSLSQIDGVTPLVDLLEEMRDSQASVSRREVVLDAKGEPKVLGITTSLLQGAAPFNGVIFLFIELTKLRRLEKSANLNKQLAQIGELTAGVVHELRNPLSVISGMAELIGRKTEAGDGNHEKATTIHTEARQMELLIAQFLNFAKPFELTTAVCKPGDIAARAAELNLPLAAHREVKVESARALPLPAILADAPKLSQAVTNILRNAIEVSPEGSTVNLRTTASEGYICFRIDDEGPGIHLEEGDDLFSAFFTKKEGGTGLGLSITHRIVTAHEGEVKYGNNDAGGAYFEITIPTELPGST
jgi:two-component system, NtrC family, sensor histidine kinase AtoS